MDEIILEERYLSGCNGKNIVPKYFLGQWWFLGRIMGYGLCLNATLCSDRFKFGLSFPFSFIPFSFEKLFSDIDRIEIRRDRFNQCLIGLIPKFDSSIRIYFFVRQSEKWLENFQKNNLKIEYIEKF